MSLHNIAGPGLFDGNIQKSLLLTFPVPTRYESFFWYTGRLKEGGILLRNKIHAHNTLFDQALFFAANPTQLGMTEDNGFMKYMPYQTLRPSDVGMTSNEEVKQFIIDNLLKSQIDFDSRSPQTSQSSKCGYPNDACVATRPEAICQIHTSLEIIDGFAYDRRQPTCCVEWEWESGQTFTVIGFNKHMGYPIGPHKPDMRDIPEFLPGHVGFWLSYDTHENKEVSHWGYSLYNHNPAGGLDNPSVLAGYQKIAMFLNGFSSPNFNDWRETPNAIPAIIIYFIISHIPFFMLILLFSIGFIVWKYLCQKNYTSSNYKKNESNTAVVGTNKIGHRDDEERTPFLNKL
jgi:hypothetical protein